MPQAPVPLEGSSLFGIEEPEYRPTFVSDGSGLSSRPAPTGGNPDAEVAEVDLGPAVHRTPGEVRGMLSAFRSGVERGRNRPGAGLSDPDEEEL